MIVLRPEPARWSVACTACAHAGVPSGTVGRTFEAEVPGCAHDALVRAGTLGPVDVADGEARQEWVDPALPEDGDLSREARVMVEEAQFDRAWQLFFAEREDEL